MEGYGVDAYLHLPVLGDECENLSPRVSNSPGNLDSTLHYHSTDPIHYSWKTNETQWKKKQSKEHIWNETNARFCERKIRKHIAKSPDPLANCLSLLTFSKLKSLITCCCCCCCFSWFLEWYNTTLVIIIIIGGWRDLMDNIKSTSSKTSSNLNVIWIWFWNMIQLFYIFPTNKTNETNQLVIVKCARCGKNLKRVTPIVVSIK